MRDDKDDEEIMMKQIQIRIFPDGKVQGETKGIKGRACLDYVDVLEKLTGARAVDSDYTGEYYEADNVLSNEQYAQSYGLNN